MTTFLSSITFLEAFFIFIGFWIAIVLTLLNKNTKKLLFLPGFLRVSATASSVLQKRAVSELQKINPSRIWKNFDAFVVWAKATNSLEFWTEVFARSPFGGNPKQAYERVLLARKSPAEYDKFILSFHSVHLTEGPANILTWFSFMLQTNKALLIALFFSSVLLLGFFNYYSREQTIDKAGLICLEDARAFALKLIKRADAADALSLKAKVARFDSIIAEDLLLRTFQDNPLFLLSSPQYLILLNLLANSAYGITQVAGLKTSQTVIWGILDHFHLCPQLNLFLGLF